MGPYEDRCSQEQEKMRGIKSIYASLFMEAHVVHMANWHDSLSLILVISMQFV